MLGHTQHLLGPVASRKECYRKAKHWRTDALQLTAVKSISWLVNIAACLVKANPRPNTDQQNVYLKILQGCAVAHLMCSPLLSEPLTAVRHVKFCPLSGRCAILDVKSWPKEAPGTPARSASLTP